LGWRKKTLAEEQEAARAVEADELDFGAESEAVEEAGSDRRAARRLLAQQALGQVEVVHDLVAVVVHLGLVAVVVSDRGIDGNAVDHVAIRLEVREVPVVVLVSGRTHRQTEEAAPGVDVVAGGQDQPHALAVHRSSKRLRDLALPPRLRGRTPHARAEVSDHGHRQRSASASGWGWVRKRLS
jgi:hypothetical protein